MNNDKVQVWLYDTTDKNKLTGTVLRDKDTTLSPGQTFIKPADKIYGIPMFDEQQQHWFGMSKEEWLKSNPRHGVDNAGPSQQQTLLANLMKQNADLQKQVQTQATVNATIMKSIAELKSQAK